MRAVEIIRKKRDGLENLPEEIRFLIDGSLKGNIPLYQMAAWLMAVFLRGLSDAEMVALTQILAHSGRVIDFSFISGAKIDKHSTGGVGDKTSLIVAPLVAAAGVYVPMISGRSLGHTGGTLDKLESIPGFKTDLPLHTFVSLVRDHGFAMLGQTEELAPADRLLYALRDATATVEHIPLIVASIVSKKVAEGADGVVLDVKTGAGAFLKTLPESERLAQALVQTFRRMNKKAVAVISDMSQPLGAKVGNALEIMESIEVLQGGGPQDLRDLTIELAARMLVLGDKAPDLEAGRALACRQIETGAGLRKLRKLIEAQGGDPAVLDNTDRLPRAAFYFDYPADRAGYLEQARADLLGRAAMLLGAGRGHMESTIDPAVGLELFKKVGDPVKKGEPLLRLHYNDESHLQTALKLLPKAFAFADDPVPSPSLIHKIIE